MSVRKLNPYIHFNGTAEKAIKLAGHVLGRQARHASDAYGVHWILTCENKAA